MAREQPFPQVLIEDRAFSQVLLGHNPFLGFCYYSKARAKEHDERFRDPARIEEVILAALEAGARGMMVSLGSPRQEMIVDALGRACAAFGERVPMLAILTPPFEDQKEVLARGNAQVGLLHGQVTDKLYRPETRDFAPEFDQHLATMRKLGLIPGASTHNGGETIPAMAGHDVAVVNTPVNQVGWHMRPSREAALAAVAAAGRRVVAMKPLAMGRVAPDEAFRFTLAQPGVDLVVVGAASPAEAEETFGFAREALAAVAA